MLKAGKIRYEEISQSLSGIVSTKVLIGELQQHENWTLVLRVYGLYSDLYARVSVHGTRRVG